VKILLVDDDPIVILLQKKLMEKAGIEKPVISFNSGEEAVSYLVKSVEENEEYLVFLDINMPGLSGWDVLEVIGEMKIQPKVKVIIITSSIDEEDREKAVKFDKIIGFWVKPFSIQDFTDLKASKEFTGLL